MLALRRGASAIEHEDYMEGIAQIASKKKANLMYYAFLVCWIMNYKSGCVNCYDLSFKCMLI